MTLCFITSLSITTNDKIQISRAFSPMIIIIRLSVLNILCLAFGPKLSSIQAQMSIQTSGSMLTEHWLDVPARVTFKLSLARPSVFSRVELHLFLVRYFTLVSFIGRTQLHLVVTGMLFDCLNPRLHPIGSSAYCHFLPFCMEQPPG